MYSSANFFCFKLSFANFPPPFLTKIKKTVVKLSKKYI
nr:MAG TPA: hypothetical protein [Caudoviricetes sp.]